MAGRYSYAQPHFWGLLFKCMFAGDSIAWPSFFFSPCIYFLFLTLLQVYALESIIQ